jgi:Flp pilus assembly protein TadD
MAKVDIDMPGKRWTAFALLLLVIFLLYSNTFRASWHFDDYPNIVNNPFIKITGLNPKTLKNTFFASQEGGLYLGKKVYRPVACLTLALNWYFGKNDVFGYHLVNVSIHFLTSFILFLTLFSLFQTPNLRYKYAGNEYFIALLTAVLWAVHPIQIQAVTYIVQRMASLAAMFYILGLYFYIKGRISDSSRKMIMLFGACLLSYLLAMGSKENAAMLPIAIILLEMIFFQDLSQPKVKKAAYGSLVICGLSIPLLGILFIFHGDFSALLSAYGVRNFTPLQRLMTEPRILIFYLSLIFYPIPTRFSIEHYVPLSTSLFHPWTTLPSIGLVLLLIGSAIFQIRKRPILSFAILFFFLNQLIESTIIGLELIFEHRNYLPSLFLFFPMSVGIKWILDYYRKKMRSMFLILISSLTILIIGLGMGTYIRNFAWTTEKALWEDAMAKAPERSRPYQNLAWGYYEKIGDSDKAYSLYEKAFELEGAQPAYSQLQSLSNMAVICYKKGEYEKAIELSKRAINIYKYWEPAQHIMTLSLLNLEKWQEASKNAELLLSKNHLNKDYSILYAYSLVKLKKYRKALNHFRNALRMYPNDKKILYNIGVTLTLMGNYDRAEWFLKAAKQISTSNILTLFYLIENRLKAGDPKSAERYLEDLFAHHSIHNIKGVVRGISKDNLMLTFSPEVMVPVISRKIEEKSREVEALGKDQSDDVQLTKRGESHAN